MEYEVGKWHGWNGGECPVHPEAVVDCVCVDHIFGTPSIIKCLAYEAKWRCGISDIVAFRVIKEYKEPREFWLIDGGYMNHAGFVRKSDAKQCALVHGGEIIHVQEVI